MGLDSVEFVFAIEDTFGITILNHDAEQFGTPRHVVVYLLGHLASDQAPEPGQQWSRPQVEEIVGRLMREELGIKVFSWDDRFGKDLGVD